MIYCPRCGRELPDEAAFCAACGAKIIMRTDDPVPAAEEPVKAVEFAPAADEPVEFAPAADEPVEFAPAAEEPVEFAPAADEPVEFAPAAEEPVEFAPAADEPVEFVPAAEEPVSEHFDPTVSSIRETLGVPPAPVFDEPKKTPVREEPVREDAREEEPRRKKPEQPVTAASMLAALGFALAFISPFPAIILSALAKKGLRKKRPNTFSRLANWGLFLGIVFTAAVIGVLIATYSLWFSLIADVFK